MGMPRAAAPAQLAARRRRTGGLGERRNRQPLNGHAADRVGVGLVLLALLLQFLLLLAEELGRVRVVRRLQVARPEIAGLHHVQVAVDNEIAFACHVVLLQWIEQPIRARKN
jgi:hypothetical protein